MAPAGQVVLGGAPLHVLGDRTDDRSPTSGDDLAHEVVDKSRTPVSRHVLQPDPDRVEPHGRQPGRRVADPDPIGPPGQPPPGQFDELRHDVNAIGLDIQAFVSGPTPHAFHQVAVGATAVQKRAAPVQRVHHESVQLASSPLLPDCSHGVAAPR